ncbi:MAG TPA: LON peptidase substrate-binding domain-containing protein, partial [Vitreoscilla sp.]|nr:LON peptidase substrate-binding domain-containing protein [Vitreoscilla sp.]
MTGRSSAAKNKQTLPMLPLRDVVVYPFMVIPLFVGRDKSIAALEAAMEKDEPVFLLAQLNPSEEDPKANDLHKMGTIANVLQMLKLPDGTVKVLVEGVERAQVVSLNDTDQEFFVANIERVEEFQDDPV